ICRDLGGDGLRVNGVSDHVHIVTTLPRTLSAAWMIEKIKKGSSKWIKTIDRRYRGFFRQRGYGALSVSPSQLRAVIKYVDEQEEHHRTRTFQEEYRSASARRLHGLPGESGGLGELSQTQSPKWHQDRSRRRLGPS